MADPGYSYDANGNMTADGLNTLAYDAEDRLVTSSGSTYSYDGNGLRVKKVSGVTTTVYMFSGSKVIAEYENGALPAAPTREYIYAGGQLLATLTGATTTYHHADRLSVRVSTDGTPSSPTYGQVIGQQGHYPYGETWYAVNTTTKFIFTSYERDSESGNDYAMARFYISRFGRFSCVDPVLGWPADPQSWNRYVYVRNDPVNLTDPSGQFWGFLVHLFVALFHAIFHALGAIGAHLGQAFGVLGQTQVGTLTLNGGYMTSFTGPVISTTVWTTQIPIYATTVNAAAAAGYAGIGAGAAAGAAPLAGGPASALPAQQQAPKPKQPTDCFAQLKYRPVNDFRARAIGATHSFWYVQNRTGAQYIVSGGPSNPNGSGYLNVGVNPNIKTGVDNVSARTAWNSGLSPRNCNGVDSLLDAARSISATGERIPPLDRAK